MPRKKKNVKADFEAQIQSVIENAIDEVRSILDQQIKEQFAQFIEGRSTAGPSKRGPGRPPAAPKKKAAATKKRRKTGSTRVRVEEVAAAALEFLCNASGPVSINEISEATRYPLEKLRRALGVLHTANKIAKSGKARATRYAVGAGKPMRKVAKKATPAKKKTSKKKAASNKRAVAKK